MFRMLWLILLAAIAPAIHAETVKVVTLNLEWFPGQRNMPDPLEMARHREEVRHTLEQLNPDILIATEVCDPDDLREVLSGITGLTLHVTSNFKDADDDPTRRNQQIAIASRLPAAAGWFEPWEQTMEGLRRGFSFVALENPKTGRLVLVYGLHLKSNRSETPEEAQMNYDIRDNSTRQLLRHTTVMQKQFAGRGIDGWIIGGDMNTNHDGHFGDQVIAMLVEDGFWNTWARVPADQRPTWKGREEKFSPITFDYIFLKNLGEPDATLGVVPQTVSDHNAVIVDIELPEE